MRIGTWNLEGRWDERHAAFVAALACDVLLLTEVPERTSVDGMAVHRTARDMAPRRAWAAVAARADLPFEPLPDPHGASALAVVDGAVVCASVLPWNGCGASDPWAGSGTTERTERAVAAIEPVAPVVWGGDWNHAMSGRERAGSTGGRAAIVASVGRLGLVVPTAGLPHRIDGLLSIDHVAVPAEATVLAAEHHVAEEQGRRLSDHDAYVVEVGSLGRALGSTA